MPSLPRERSLSSDPIQQFKRWFNEARRHPGIDLPEAMCLATVNAQGGPSARMLLMKGMDRRGFTFFTNIESPKAKDLLARPKAALIFHWRPLRRQVRIEGAAVREPKKIADAYFATRPRVSQLGSWASQQSKPLSGREELIRRLHLFEEKFRGNKIPAPPHWQGFRVVPERIEFWQEGPNRLHDRWAYEKRPGGKWKRTRLFP